MKLEDVESKAQKMQDTAKSALGGEWHEIGSSQFQWDRLYDMEWEDPQLENMRSYLFSQIECLMMKYNSEWHVRCTEGR